MRIYVADNRHGTETGEILGYDLSTGEKIWSLPTQYNPDVAASRDGTRLFVAHSYLDRAVQAADRDELTLYDGRTHARIHSDSFRWRSLYNVAPTSPALVVSEDAKFCYVWKTETLGDDKANYSIGVFDAVVGKFRHRDMKVPYPVMHFESIPGRAELHFTLTGRLGEAVAVADPREEPELHKAHEFGSPWSHEGRFALAGSCAHPNGRIVTLLSRGSALRLWNPWTNLLSEPVQLSMRPGAAVALQHLISMGNRLLLGTADRESAARGLSTHLEIFETDGGFFRTATWSLDPPAEKIYLSPDGTHLVTLSRDRRMVTVLDSDGRVLRRIEEIGVSPVAGALCLEPPA